MSGGDSEESITTFKILLIGSSGTGKSSLLLRFTNDTFLEDEMSATIGVDFKVKFWNVPAQSQQSGASNKIKLTLWDTAGQERFRTLTSSYYRGAHGVILVYDVTNRESFDALWDTWLPELETFSSPNAPNIKMIVGNKIDRDAERVVSREEGLEAAKNHGALFLECSAKTKVGVQQAFDELCLKILENPKVWDAKVRETLRINTNAQQDDDSSCAC
ncbi:hypothetical protein MIR68_002285 [Amoeboaphelidium protococcarum]|nr:hypothetical protein MIR68_002285 [Amoeboaphelidium protococcarum]